MSLLKRFMPDPARFQNKPVEGNIRKGEWHWSHTIMVVGVFAGIWCIAFFSKKTVIDNEILWRYIFFGCLVFLVVPYRFYRDKLKLERLEMVLLNVLGIGPLLISLLLILNFSFITDRRTETYKIEDYENIGIFFSPGDVLLRYENDELSDQPGMRTFDSRQHNDLHGAGYVTYEVGKGILGYEVIRNIEFKKEDSRKQNTL